MNTLRQEPAARPGTPEPVGVRGRPVPRWALHRRLYDWMLSFSHSRYATLALAIFSFAEAIFFPIPPFVLQIPLSLERQSRTWYYALVCTVASVGGGIGGYALGGAFHGVAIWLFGEAKLHQLEQWTGNVWLLTAGAVAIHPFKLYTIAAGFLTVPMGSFVLAATIGRAALFFGIGALLWFFGAPVRTFIDRYFNLLTVALGALIVGVVVLAKVL